jgi:AsmA protein
MKRSTKKSPPQPKEEQAAKSGPLMGALLGVYGVTGVVVSYAGIHLPFSEGLAKDYWRNALAGFVLLLAMLVGLLGFALSMVDANVFKSQIVDYVKTNMQRDLQLDGDIELAVFPKLGLDFGKMTLSQRNSAQKFASVDKARFFIAWWPLFLKQVQIERIALDGVHANVTRHKDGSSNFDDLLASNGSLSGIQFEVEKIRVYDSSVNYRDEAADLTLTLHDLDVETGKIAENHPGDIKAKFRLESDKPRIDARVKLASHVLLDRTANRYELANFEVNAQGEAAGVNNLALDLHGSLVAYPVTRQLELDKLTAALTGKLDNRKLESKLELASLKLDKDKLLKGTSLAFSVSAQQDSESSVMSMDVPAFTLKEGKLEAASMLANFDFSQSGRTLQGKFSSPLSYSFESRQLQLPAIESTFNASHPSLTGKINASTSADLQASLADQDVKLSFKTKVDDSQFTGSVQWQDFKSPVYTFDVAVNALDLDRYLAVDWAKRMQDEVTPFDLQALKTLNLRGKLRSSGEFKFARLKASELVAEIRADQFALNIESLSARLYGGTTSGSISLAPGDAPKFMLRQKLVGVQLGELLSDMSGAESWLTGKGNLALDLSAEGNNPVAMRKGLSGNASLQLARGTLAGLNLGDLLVAGKDQLGVKDAERSASAKATENTAFTELKSSFEFTQGQARSSDFSLKSANFTAKGEGQIALDTGALSYQLSTTVAPNLKRNSAGELADLSGITIPMHVSGPASSAAITLSLADASGSNLARLTKANLAKATTPTLTVKSQP